MKKLYFVILFYALSSALSAANFPVKILNPPVTYHCDEPQARLNQIIYGATPPGSENKPVLIFVHGWFDIGYGWFALGNDWYQRTYAEGYRTAFFDQSASNSLEKNGQVIADMVRQTCAYYGVDHVVAICHSKGGLDMEFAMYNSGIADSIKGVVSLASPYFGAAMGDVIAAPIIKDILDIVPFGIGDVFKDKGTFQLQSAYMAGVVRPMMDNNPANQPDKNRCLASWGSDHHTELPDLMDNDLFAVGFYNIAPPCGKVPLINNFYEGLVQVFFTLMGDLSRFVTVPKKYSNPANNTKWNDGLSAFYGAVRPGGTLVVNQPPDSQAYWNHLDVFYAPEVWNIVDSQISYIQTHQLRANTPVVQRKQQSAYENSGSNAQLLQSKTGKNVFYVENADAKIRFIGSNNHQQFIITDESGREVFNSKTKNTTNNLLNIFQSYELKDLPKNKKYIVESNDPFIAFVSGADNTMMKLNFGDDDFLSLNNISVDFDNLSENISDIKVEATLNRNMDMNGDIVQDKIISLHFELREGKYICTDNLALPDGIYNLSVFANGNTLNKFTTSSIILQSKHQYATGISSLYIYPNPVKDVLSMELNIGESGNYSIEIFDVLGKKISTKDIGNTEKGIHQLQLPVNEFSLSAGSYILSLVKDNERKAAKLVVVN